MPPGEKKASNHLMACVAVLIIVTMALLTTVILMKTGSRPDLSREKAWLHPRYEHSRPAATKTAKPIPTDFPTELPTDLLTTATTKKPRNVCETPECIHLAHQLHNYRDPSIDPCEDFYKSTCGKYNEHNIEDGPGMVKSSRIVLRLIEEFLLKNKTTTSKSERDMHLLYGKCEENRNAPNVTAENVKILKEMFESVQRTGSWPLLDRNWNESSFDLTEAMTRYVKLGVPASGFFSVSGEADSRLLIRSFHAPSNEFNSKPDAFKQTVREILEISNFQFDEQVLEEDLKSYELLKKQMKKIPRATKANWRKFEEFQQQVPSIDLERFLKSFINPDKDDDEIWNKIKGSIQVFDQPLFFSEAKHLETILTTTSKRTLANYLFFRLLDFLLMRFQIEKQKTCTNVVASELPVAALRVFVRNHFDKENLKITSDMVDDFKLSFIEMIQESTWLHDETKKNAIRKVEMIKTMIGYPDELEEPGALDKIFESLNISPEDSYFTLNQKISKFQIWQMIDFVAGLGRIESSKTKLMANASYSIFWNWLTVNVPLLDDPQFDATYPAYAKIAGVGMVIGHEIGHGFDPKGRQRDGIGEDNNWWTSVDSEEYDKRAQCLVEQYDNYDDPRYGKNLNGTIAIGENVADTLGVNVAWRTYKKLDIAKEPGLVGFENYSMDKLYFQIAAMTWCAPHKTISLEKQLKDDHATENFRINGIFSNMKSFAETFNCPIGSPMNPEKKCEMF